MIHLHYLILNYKIYTKLAKNFGRSTLYVQLWNALTLYFNNFCAL